MDRPYFIYWHLKAKNKKCNVDLIKNYCITVSMQKISSIHKLIQQILGYHELNDHTHFWPGPHKNHWNNSLLSWSCNTMQKISSFHQFILEIQSRDQITVGGQWKPTRNKKTARSFYRKNWLVFILMTRFFFLTIKKSEKTTTFFNVSWHFLHILYE